MKMTLVISSILALLIVTFLALNFMAPDISIENRHEQKVKEFSQSNPANKYVMYNKYIGIRIGSNIIDYKYLVAEVSKDGAVVGHYYYDKSVFGSTGTLYFKPYVYR